MIIPTLNEETSIGDLLRRLSETAGVFEILVADGGSNDATPDLVLPPARLLPCEPGRGVQLRTGARHAKGDVLLFLHADVVPPPDLTAQISDALRGGCVGGNFHLRYPQGGPLGRWLEVLAPLYRRVPRYYGDSGIFVRRDVYEACGGMPHIPIMEDVVFVRRLERMGKTAYLPGPMISASRRWSGRGLQTLILWGFMQLAHALGASPWRLSGYYQARKG
ncbi:MAG: TIGR04283 family arsenosugar biosynthesis glycosyltransferase [Rubrobacter sp.]